MSEMPELQKAAFSSVPGICLAKSAEKCPCTVEMWTPAFSNTRPWSIDISPPPPSARVQGFRSKRPAGRSALGPVTHFKSQLGGELQLNLELARPDRALLRLGSNARAAAARATNAARRIVRRRRKEEA